MDKCVSTGPSMVKLGTRYTFKFYIDICFLELCAENSVIGLGVLLFMFLILVFIWAWYCVGCLICSVIKCKIYLLIFHAVTRSLECKAFVNVKKRISTLFFLYLFSFFLGMLTFLKYCYLCYLDVCRCFNTIHSAYISPWVAELYVMNSLIFPLYFIS